MISFPLITRLTFVVLCLTCWLDSAELALAPVASWTVRTRTGVGERGGLKTKLARGGSDDE